MFRLLVKCVLLSGKVILLRVALIILRHSKLNKIEIGQFLTMKKAENIKQKLVIIKVSAMISGILPQYLSKKAPKITANITEKTKAAKGTSLSKSSSRPSLFRNILSALKVVLLKYHIKKGIPNIVR